MVIANNIICVMANSKYVEEDGRNTYGGYTYQKDVNDNIIVVENESGILFTATYDLNNLRTEKNGIDNSRYVYVDRRLEEEVRNDIFIDYLYSYEEEEYNLQGFVYDGIQYNYVFGDYYLIEGIADEQGNEVCRYIYGENGMAISEVLGISDGQWINNDDPKFIGNINRVRFRGEYLDEETNWYYNGVYFDSNTTDIVTLEHVYDVIPDINPFSDSELQAFSVDDLDLEVQQYAATLLADSEFNNAVETSGTWYENISTLEFLARVIYGENTSVTADQNAIAWVILNRLKDGSFGGNTIYGVLSKERQFETVSNPTTVVLKAQSHKDSGWESAVYLACLFYTTQDKSDWNSLGIPPAEMGEQLYFNGWSCRNLFTCSNGVIYKGNTVVYDVYVVGYGNITTASDITNFKNRFSNSKRNIYFNTNWEER